MTTSRPGRHIHILIGGKNMQNFKETLMYSLKRIVLMLVTFLIIFIIAFALIRMIPLSFSGGAGTDLEKQYLEYVKIGRLYYDVKSGTYKENPLPVQFWYFLRNFFYPYVRNEDGTLEAVSRWGYSRVVEKNSTPEQILFSRMPITVVMNLYSIIFSVPLGIGLGIFMALKKNKWQDNVLNVVVMVFISIPGFVFAFLLQYFFGYKWQLLPPITEAVSVVGLFSPEMFKSMILPILAMSLGSIAAYARYTRAELTEVLTSDFMLLARTKGLNRGQATIRHALRNSMVPIFPMILGEFISILGGSIIIEQIFGVNGVGGIYLQSCTGAEKDLDVFQFVSMFYVLIGLVGGLIVDISYGIVDPRIRMGGGKDNAY